MMNITTHYPTYDTSVEYSECDRCGATTYGRSTTCQCEDPLYCEQFNIICPNEGRGNKKFAACLACEKYAVTEWPRPGVPWRRLK